MAHGKEVVFVDGVRTPFGRAGEKGQYWGTRADDLIVKAMIGLLERNPNVPQERIDDVAIVADHLHVVAWLWRNASGEAGLWYLEESRRDDWGHAMRALQLYLQVREAEREHEEVP